MKLLLSLFLTFTAYATEYLVYPNSQAQTDILIKELSATEVFGEAEKKLLPKGFRKLVLKVKANKELIQLKCNGCAIEDNNSARFFNRYQKYQWNLSNSGKEIKRWLTDIDVRYIQAKKTEDLNLGANKETSKKIRVAIIDSGVDLMHPDLRGQFFEDKKECKDLKAYNKCLKFNSDRDSCHEKYAKIDHNKNGYPLDCNGWNITGKSNPKSQITGNANINDKDGHGTHVAGIVGALDNRMGVKGIIQNVELLPVQVSTSSQNKTGNDLPTDNIAKGLLYAISNDAKVINLSLGWRINQDSVLMRDMIKLALSKNILVVAAAGNDAHDEAVFPCSYQGVICVASHDVDGKLSSFSNYGAHVDITAPGNDILSTYPRSKRSRSFTEDPNYEYLSGTSQAAPQVTALLARLLNLDFTAQEAKAKLLNGARKKSNSHKYVRFGNVDFKSALKANDKLIEIKSKSASLINISKNRTFTFKLQNFNLLNYKVQISSPELNFEKNHFTVKGLKEFKIQTNILNQELLKKSYYIDVNISSNRFNKKYLLQVNPIMVISTKNKSTRVRSFPIAKKRDFSPAIVKKFQNYFDQETSYLGIKEVNGITFIQAITYGNNGYQELPAVTLTKKNNVILNISKVDLDLDGRANYVITYVSLEDKNRETFFKVYEEDFSESKLLVAPNNKFKNTKTTLPGSFIWTKKQDRMLITWVGFGLNPSFKQTSPWGPKKDTKQIYRIYQLDSASLKSIQLEDETYPVAFLYQSKNDRRAHRLFFVAANGLGYKKSYSVHSLTQSTPKFISDFNTEYYFNFVESSPLPLVNSESSNAFFTLDTVSGAQRVVAIEANTEGIKLSQKELTPLSALKPILRVLRYSMDQEAIAQTASSLLVFTKDAAIEKTSYTNAKRIKHHLMSKKMGVILSESYTFNLSSYGMFLEDDEVKEPPYLQAFAAGGCQEIGLETKNDKEYLSYFCESSKEILKLEVSN